MTPDIALAFLVLFGGHWLLLRRFVLHDLPPFGKGLLVLLYGLHFLLIALFYAARGWDEVWSWYFDYRFGEYNPAASYAATLYVLIALGALLSAVRGQALPLFQRGYWLGTGLLFGFLGLDEYFVLHEGVKNWTLYYGLAAVLLTLGSAVVLRQRRDWRVAVMIVGGLGAAGAGGIGLELLALHDCFGYLGQTCNRLPLIEEALENVGILTVLAGVVLYASQHVRPVVWRQARALLVAGGVGTAIILLTGPWFIPALEMQLRAEPVQLDYLDGALSILGYQVSQTVLHPGDPLDMTVYWQVNQRTSGLDGFSAHLVSRTSGQSFASSNRLVEEPRFTQAVPGTVYRTNVHLVLPPDTPAQASYWLTLTTWGRRRQTYQMQPVSRTDRELIALDMAVLCSLPVIDESSPLTVDHPLRFDFQENLSLTGYSVQAEKRRLSLQFVWENHRPIREPLIQFLHIFGPDGGFVYSLDRPPLADDFPTIDWPVGLRARADWQLDLPDDLEPGEYSLRTGLYEAKSLNRWLVRDSEGHELPDGIIELRTIRLES